MLTALDEVTVAGPATLTVDDAPVSEIGPELTIVTVGALIVIPAGVIMICVGPHINVIITFDDNAKAKARDVPIESSHASLGRPARRIGRRVLRRRGRGARTGAGRPLKFGVSALAFFIETLVAVLLLAFIIYLFYRNSARLADWIGPTGTTIVMRLSAFLLFCIGIQVLWNGSAALLGSLPFGPAAVN